MDAFKTHGAFSWSELMTDDPGQAALLYGSLFGRNLDKVDLPGGNYLVVKVGESAVAGMMAWPDPFQLMASAWDCYVTVDDVDAAVARCPALGGTVQMPAMDIPKVGRMASIRDPQRASVNIITYLPRKRMMRRARIILGS